MTELPSDWREATAGIDPALAQELSDAWYLRITEPRRAAQRAERLFPKLSREGGLAPWLAMVIAVSGRIQTLSDFHPLDPFLDYFSEQRRFLVASEEFCRQVDASYFGALVFRRPGDHRIDHWAERCLEVFRSDGDTVARLNAANYLLLYRIWRGDLLGADALCSQMTGLCQQTDEVYPRLLCHSVTSMVRRLLLDYSACMEEIDKGLELAEASGLRHWDSQFYMQSAFLALSRENLEEAEASLMQMEGVSPPEHFLDRSGYHYARAWLHHARGASERALRHALEAVELAQRSGAVFPRAITHVAVAQLCLERRQLRQALHHVRCAHRAGRQLKGGHALTFIRGLIQAYLAFKVGMRRHGLIALRRALTVGREQHYVNYPWWRNGFMATLCARAIEAGIEPEYARLLIRLRRLRPPCWLKRAHARRTGTGRCA